MEIKLAIIGGTGFYEPGLLEQSKEIEVETEYGLSRLLTGTYQKQKIAFLTRHGAKHSLPPHKINYRANIAALKKLGVERVLSTTAVGSLRQEYAPGTFVVIDQFIDQTKTRVDTFFDGEDGAVYHTDFTEPYCPQLRNSLGRHFNKQGLAYVDKGTYICTEGPRYESPAEIKAFRTWGADVVGMTGVPEVTLAREAGLCYSSLSLVTNLAAGISKSHLTHKEVIDMVDEKISIIREVFLDVLVTLPDERNCRCWEKEDIELGG